MEIKLGGKILDRIELVGHKVVQGHFYLIDIAWEARIEHLFRI